MHERNKRCLGWYTQGLETAEKGIRHGLISERQINGEMVFFEGWYNACIYVENLQEGLALGIWPKEEPS